MVYSSVYFRLHMQWAGWDRVGVGFTVVLILACIHTCADGWDGMGWSGFGGRKRERGWMIWIVLYST
jgi:hypothetical protein